MPIGNFNIKSRIELETRVLAAALKQSFEREDNDGVSLAHRQLFLLLKDQRSNNGDTSTTTSETPVEPSLSNQGNISEPADQISTDKPPAQVAEADNHDAREPDEPLLFPEPSVINQTQSGYSDVPVPSKDEWGRVSRTFESYQFDENGELIKVEKLPEREASSAWSAESAQLPVQAFEFEEGADPNQPPEEQPATIFGSTEEEEEEAEEVQEEVQQEEEEEEEEEPGSETPIEEVQFEPPALAFEYTNSSSQQLEQQRSVDDIDSELREASVSAEEFSPPQSASDHSAQSEELSVDAQELASPTAQSEDFLSQNSQGYSSPAVQSGEFPVQPQEYPSPPLSAELGSQSAQPEFTDFSVGQSSEFITPLPDYTGFGASLGSQNQSPDAFSAIQDQSLSAPSFYKPADKEPPSTEPAVNAKKEMPQPQVFDGDWQAKELVAAIEPQEPEVIEVSAPQVVPEEMGTRNLFEQMQQFTAPYDGAADQRNLGYGSDLASQSGTYTIPEDFLPFSLEAQAAAQPFATAADAQVNQQNVNSGQAENAVPTGWVELSTVRFQPLETTPKSNQANTRLPQPPRQSAPATTSPPVVAPAQTAPPQGAAPQATPAQATPAQAIPAQATPVQATPVQATPVQATPAQAAASGQAGTPQAAASRPKAAATSATTYGAAEDDARTQTARSAAEAMVTEAEEALSLEMPRTENMYALLGVSQMSPQRDIHKSCLCKTRKVLRSLKGKARPERDVLLKELRKLWIAHDILVDPVTRTDYDFRELGLRGTDANNIPIPEDHQSGRLGSRTPLRIGELLQCAGLLEMAELEIACDMHKAMPEVQFGTFLVKQGFIQERDLDSVLLGQRLLRDGKITVAQFQVAMELSQSRGVPISETLIEHGYLTAEDLVPEVAHEERGEPPDPVPSIREVPVRPKAQELMRAELNQGKSVPTWRDQLDWSRPIEVVDDHSVERAADKQSLARLLGGGAQADPNSVANENYPSWKDQLDWEKPDEYAVPPASLGSVDPSKQPSASHWHEQLDWSTPQEYAGDQSNASQEPRFPLEMFEPLPGEAPLSATPDMVPEISLANPSLGEVSESQAISSTGQPQFNPESLYSHLQNLGEAQELPAFNFDRQQGGPSSPSGETNALPESSLISARAFEYFSETAGHSGPEPGHMPESGASVVPDSTQQEPATTPEAEKRPPTRIESSKKKQFKNKKEVGSKKEDDNKKEDDAKKQVEAKKAADSKKEVDKRDKRKKRR